MRPRGDVQPALPPQILHQVAIDDAKLQPEFIAHLVAPLHLQGGGADDEDLAGTVTNDEFLADQPGLDGFTQANVIGDQQVDAGHLDRSRHGVKLVVFQFDTAAEGRLQCFDIATGGSSPADSIEKGIEPVRSVKANGRGQHILFGDPGARLYLPDHLQILAQGIILNRSQRDQVLAFVILVLLTQSTCLEQIGR